MTKSKRVSLLTLAVLFVLAAVAFICLNTAKPSASADETSEALAKFDFYMYASNMDFGVINEATEIEDDDGSIIIGASADKTFSVDANAKFGFVPKADDLEDSFILPFTRRLKSGGVSELVSLDRTLSFYLKQKAKIYIYALSSSSGDSTRTINLRKNGSNEDIASETVLNTATYFDPIIFETTEAGSYYLHVGVNGINFYFVGIEYTGEAEGTTERAAWSGVATPAISTVAITTKEGVANPSSVTVGYTANIATDGGDFLVVKMLDSANNVISKRTVLKYGTSGTVSFIPPKSDDAYTFTAELSRQGETEIKKSAVSAPFAFTLPLETPRLRARTGENQKMIVTIGSVKEADSYVLSYKINGSTDEATVVPVTIPAEATNEIVTEVQLTAADVNKKYDFSVYAVRKDTGEAGADENSKTNTYSATMRATAERDWAFAAFGQSTSTGKNQMNSGGNIFDGLTLRSCTYDTATSIETAVASNKGGKFTYGGFDGLSYYYTAIKANEEDFRLKAEVTVDYINPTPDGQEGFALLVRDSVGEHGSADLYYTNSVAAIATKIQYYVGIGRNTVRDGLGARFVTGLTSTYTTPNPADLSQKMYSLDPSEVVYSGAKYIMEVEKKNNCYFVRYYGRVDSDTPIAEYALYHDGTDTVDGNDQLLSIDKENVYVGFAVARGCNATFGKVEFEVTPRSTDFIPVDKTDVILGASVTSNTTSSVKDYEFVFFANADGLLDVSLNEAPIVTGAKITSMTDYKTNTTLTSGANTFDYTFTPDADYAPSETEELDTKEPRKGTFQVTCNSYATKKEALIVAPETRTEGLKAGNAGNDGTYESPLNLQTAINYLLPGQTIYLLEGVYEVTSGNITIERGNNGTQAEPKVIRPHPECKTRPVIDNKNKGGGFTVWGNYWHLYGFDLINTAKGKKGIQLGGFNNTLELINTYNNGDSGIAVSGKSTDDKAKWPTNNLVKNCTSYSNFDIAQEDADGFAAKLYTGEGNKFVGCIAYCNADDGWDCYAKTESGQIGAVTVENCIAFGNGFYINGTRTRGNGNGFKLGGESLPAKHELKNSVSFANAMKGVDSNSCPDIKVSNTLSVYNGSYNFAFYTSASPTTDFEVSGIISLNGGGTDNIQIRQRKKPVYKVDNFFFFASVAETGADASTHNEEGKNTEGVEKADVVIDESILKGYDAATGMQGYIGLTLNREGDGNLPQGNYEYVIGKVTVRDADGSINTNGLFELTDKAPTSAGARLVKTTGTDWSAADAAITNVKMPSVKGIEDNKDNTLLIILIIVGVVVLAGGGFCLYWFVFRKKKEIATVTSGADDNSSDSDTPQE